MKQSRGYYVTGRVLSPTPEYHSWWYDSEDQAMVFAKFLCEESREDVVISKIIGVFRPTKLPVEYIPSNELE